MLDISSVRKEFPILEKKIRGKPLCYLDNGASAQKPKVVIDTIIKGYESEYANVHRGLHFLSNLEFRAHGVSQNLRPRQI